MLRQSGLASGSNTSGSATTVVSLEAPSAIQTVVLKQRQELLRGNADGTSATTLGIEGGDLLVVVLGSMTHRLSANVLRTAEELRKEVQDTSFDSLLAQQQQAANSGGSTSAPPAGRTRSPSLGQTAKSGTNLLGKSTNRSTSPMAQAQLSSFSDRIRVPSNSKLRFILTPSEDNTTFYHKNRLVVGAPVMLMYARGRRVEFFATGRRSNDSLNNIAAGGIIGHLNKKAMASVVNHVLALLSTGQLKTRVSRSMLKEAEATQKAQDDELAREKKNELRERKRAARQKRGEVESDGSREEYSDSSSSPASSDADSSDDFTSSSDEDDDDLDKPFVVLMDLAYFDPL